MGEEKKIVPITLIKQHEDKIIEYWQRDMQKSNHFSNYSYNQTNDLLADSKPFLEQMLDPKFLSAVPELDPQSFEGVFKLWHSILKQQSQKGFTTKDTTVLIYTLKKSLIQYFKDQYGKSGNDYSVELNRISQLLDFLGLLTFEIYSAEKEQCINRQQKQIDYLQSNSQGIFKSLVGNSHKMKAVYKSIGLVLDNSVSVLLEGESGTGKDVVATLIHQNSNRKNKPFIIVNCGAIPKDLIESELFGHEQGAFTGASSQKIGRFELAHQGTLFLDEVGELPLDLQVKFLRALQNQEFDRLGGKHTVKVDVRVIAATNKDLKEEIKKGKFRLDLYYRLNVFPIKIPPLRERVEDIEPLVNHFLIKYTKKFKSKVTTISQEALDYLKVQKWEGNIRELENIIQRALIVCDGPILTSNVFESSEDVNFLGSANLLPLGLTGEGPGEQILSLDSVEKKAIENAILITKGNIQKAAKALGVSRTTFYNKIEKYKLKIPGKK